MEKHLKSLQSWFLEALKSRVDGLESRIAALEDQGAQCTATVETLKTEFDSFRASSGPQAAAPDLAASLTSVANNSASLVNSADDLMQEFHERQRRASNVIFFNVDEPDHASAVDLDRSFLQEAFTRLEIEFAGSVQRFRRIGKLPAPGKSRPLLVHLSSPAIASHLLTSNRAFSPRPFSLSSDRTPAQCRQLDGLRLELKRRTDNGEPDLTIKYISGTPRIIARSNVQSTSGSQKNSSTSKNSPPSLAN
ncbi:hypothetical protein GE061_020149 [Apolygus lucorum]|uniref:Uncharacterized protein n=1 Tax=Apolygus lucorum TaxID=248454 RepID=A0A8S9WIS4_APOLU|nr:hypothetical protein GE061_020149 [Apolygus lucorum]